MKNIIPALLTSFALVRSAQAQWVVYDPTLHTQQILDQAQNIAKYVEMVNNQIQQIEQLTSQLRELEEHNQVFGDPSQFINLPGIVRMTADLRRRTLVSPMNALQARVEPEEALNYDSNGIYEPIHETFTTPSGREVERELDDYRSFAAINKITRHYTNVLGEVLQRRSSLKTEIAATTERLQAADTASEVQKLTGVLIGLNTSLAAADEDVNHAATISLVQDIENRNEIEKQAWARKEEQQTEFSESLGAYRQTFRPMAEPSIFPEE